MRKLTITMICAFWASRSRFSLHLLLLQAPLFLIPSSNITIPDVFSWVDVRSLSQPLLFFHTNLDRPYLNESHFAHSHSATGLGILDSVQQNCNAAAYRDMCTIVCFQLSQVWGKNLHMGMMVRCPHTFGQIV